MPDCEEWPGKSIKGKGYKYRWYQGKVWTAHRAAWDEQVGPIPKGMHVLHHCDNPACVLIEHLFLGTHSDNMLDAVQKRRHTQSRKTHCPQGHPYDEQNTYYPPSRPAERQCKECKRESVRRLRRKGRIAP